MSYAHAGVEYVFIVDEQFVRLITLTTLQPDYRHLHGIGRVHIAAALSADPLERAR